MFSFNNAEQAGHWFTIYSWAIFFGAFVVAFATVGANLAGSAKDRFADDRIIAGEQATERAKTDAATALERAAGLQKEAEVAKLETERVKRIVSWRFITEEQSSKLKEALVNYQAYIVNLLWVDGDPEALLRKRPLQLFLPIQRLVQLRRKPWRVRFWQPRRGSGQRGRKLRAPLTKPANNDLLQCAG